MLRKNKMRVTMTKHKTPQGDVIVERRRKPRECHDERLLRLTVLVSFLNQKYVEYHFGWWADWDRETSLLGFLYGLYIDGPLSMNDLGEFYRETKTIQEEITKLIVPALTGDSEAETMLKSQIDENLDVYLRPYPFSGKEESGFGLWRAAPGSFAVEPPTFKAYVYGILANILQDGQLVKIARCIRDGCGKFFVRPDTKGKHCSSECYKSRDSKESRKRKLNKDANGSAGRELYERAQRLARQPKIARKDKDDLDRILFKLSMRPADLGSAWISLTPNKQRAWNKAAQKFSGKPWEQFLNDAAQNVSYGRRRLN